MATAASVDVSITSSWLLSESATYSLVPSGERAASIGYAFAGSWIVSTTASFVVSTTETAPVLNVGT